MVTRSLVSYVNLLVLTTRKYVLNGHQIIGELRLIHPADIQQGSHWMVTRSLVSYVWRK